MDAREFSAALIGRLDTAMPAAISVHDGPPTSTPAGNYVYVDSAPQSRRQHIGYTDRRDHTANVVCVGIDRVGARFVADHVDTVLTDHRLDGNHPLTVIGSGGPLVDGPEGDTRTSLTLIYRLTTRRSANV